VGYRIAEDGSLSLDSLSAYLRASAYFE